MRSKEYNSDLKQGSLMQVQNLWGEGSLISEKGDHHDVMLIYQACKRGEFEYKLDYVSVRRELKYKINNNDLKQGSFMQA